MEKYELSRKKILLTGATGFIGGHLARRLLASGVNLRVLARTPEKAANLAQAGVEVVQGDLLDTGSVKAALKDCQVVISLQVCLKIFQQETRNTQGSGIRLQ